MLRLQVIQQPCLLCIFLLWEESEIVLNSFNILFIYYMEHFEGVIVHLFLFKLFSVYLWIFFGSLLIWCKEMPFRYWFLIYLGIIAICHCGYCMCTWSSCFLWFILSKWLYFKATNIKKNILFCRIFHWFLKTAFSCE